MKRYLVKSALAALLIGASVAPATATDWSGFYGGAYLGYGVSGVSVPGAGLQLGYNAPLGNDWYVGGEFDALMHIDGSNYQYYTAKLRAGLELGGNTFLFGSAGYGQTGTSTNYWSVGLGGQFPLGTNLYIRGEADAMTPISGGTTRTFVKLGVGMKF